MTICKEEYVALKDEFKSYYAQAWHGKLKVIKNFNGRLLVTADGATPMRIPERELTKV
ncbi:MAG: hypothetical protein J7647_16300 [Cyanobacteria bacterium SBLK]|nr:hypothetical protein [Cyanobacteria bacterium SBLK]